MAFRIYFLLTFLALKFILKVDSFLHRQQGQDEVIFKSCSDRHQVTLIQKILTLHLLIGMFWHRNIL